MEIINILMVLKLVTLVSSAQVTHCVSPTEMQKYCENIDDRLDLITSEMNAKFADMELRHQEEKRELEVKIEGLQKQLNGDNKPTNKLNKEAGFNLQSAFGCESDTVHLACPDNKKIFIHTADYGQYTHPCSSPEAECCIPNPLDCTESVSENSQSDWLALKTQCDNQTECDNLFQGSVFVEKCTPLAEVDYLLIYYSCTPDESTYQSGFSAYATVERTYYTDELLIFDGIISNIGGSYQTDRSTFLCPVDGVYTFAVSAATQYGKTSFEGQLMLENTVLSGFICARVDGQRLMGSTTVITECTKGQSVWVKALVDSIKLNGGTARYTTFTGFLLGSTT